MGCDQRNGIRLRQVSYGLFCRKYPVFCICPLIDFINQGNHWYLLFAYLNHSPDTQQFRIKCGNALVHIISVRMDVHSSIREMRRLAAVQNPPA